MISLKRRMLLPTPPSPALPAARAVRMVLEHQSDYDNALAETINGLYKTEAIHRCGPCPCSLSQARSVTSLNEKLAAGSFVGFGITQGSSFSGKETT